MKIAVTGAAGLTGGRVTELLIARGHDVTAVVRSGASSRRVRPGAHIAIADCRDAEQLGRAVRSADCLIHVAGIQLSDSVASTCAYGLPPRLIAVSTASATLTGHPHAAVYLMHEETLRSKRPDAIIVRPTMIYGSGRDRNVHKVVRFAHRWRFLPLPGSGTGLIQPIHYRDLADVLVALVGSDPGMTVPAGGPQPLSLADAAKAIFMSLGQQTHLVHVPLAPAIAVARVWDGMFGSRFADRLDRSRTDKVVDITRMTAVTGVSPRPFGDGLASLVAEMRASGAV